MVMNKPRSLIESFRYAFEGIGAALRGRNFKIQIAASILVIILGFIFNISESQWLIILLLISLILSLEMINTSIEKLLDFISKEKNPEIKTIKDILAGAVLIVSLIAIITGLIIFIPKIIF